jgi:hypothetical protein
MAEIVIAHPEINTDTLRSHAYAAEGSDKFQSYIRALLEESGATPASHPNVVDLCAGDGSMARILADQGWDESRILCVDRYISPTPLVENVRWAYWDLEALGRSLVLGEVLSEQIERYREGFDITCLVNGLPNQSAYGRAISRFFSKPNSLLLPFGKSFQS